MNEILTWRSIFGARGSTEGHLFLDVVDCVSGKVEPLEAVVKNRHGITTKMFDMGTGSINRTAREECPQHRNGAKRKKRSLPDARKRDFARPRATASSGNASFKILRATGRTPQLTFIKICSCRFKTTAHMILQYDDDIHNRFFFGAVGGSLGRRCLPKLGCPFDIRHPARQEP